MHSYMNENIVSWYKVQGHVPKYQININSTLAKVMAWHWTVGIQIIRANIVPDLWPYVEIGVSWDRSWVSENSSIPRDNWMLCLRLKNSQDIFAESKK